MISREAIMKYVEAFNHVDIEMLTELYADDSVNHQVVTDPVVGKEAIGRMFQDELVKTPMVCIVENILPRMNGWSLSGKNRSDSGVVKYFTLLTVK
jgi:hypothetical protein